jgi:hypothetical protein
VFSLLVLGLLAATPAAARPLVAVLDFTEARTGMHVEELAILGDIARGEALRVLGHDYDVITRESLVDLLKSHGKSLEKCSGECETETGRLLGAELVVSGRIVKAFGRFKVNLKVHRTDPPALLGAEMMSADKPEDLEEAVREGTRKILSTVPGARVSPSAPPAVTRPARSPRSSTRSVAKGVMKGVVRAVGKSAERSLAAGARSAEAASRAVSGLADQARALQQEAKSLAQAWGELEGLANNDDLSKDQRVAAVKLFLERAPEGSGYHRKATALLAELTESPAWYGARTEWFSIGYAYGSTLSGGHGGFAGFPVLKWDKVYWQTLEYVGLSLTSTYADYDSGSYLQSLASIVGYRQALTPDGRHDLRIGLGLSWLGIGDTSGCDSAFGDVACGTSDSYGQYSVAFIGLGLVPEVGWIWHMSPGTSLVTKLRFIVPVGDGYVDTYCYGGAAGSGCPWPDDSESDNSVSFDSSAAFSVGLGW